MIADDVVFLLVVLVPLFVARWRVSLLGLALQGVLLWRASGSAGGLDGLDFLGLRAIAAPALLWSVFVGRARNDMIPPNLFAWGFVGALVLGGFWFAEALDGGGPAVGRMAVATTALLLGFFVLASQDGVFSQLVGVLRVENAVALFELSLPREHGDPIVRAAQVAATAGAALLAAWYLRELRGRPTPTGEEGS